MKGIPSRVIRVGVRDGEFHQTVSTNYTVDNLVPNTFGDFIVNSKVSWECLVQSYNWLCYLSTRDVTEDMSEGIIVCFNAVREIARPFHARITEKLHGYCCLVEPLQAALDFLQAS